MDLELGDKLPFSLVICCYTFLEDCVNLLRQFCRLHLRLHDLKRNDLARGFAVFIAFCTMADGEAAFAQCCAGGIINPARFCNNWRRRISVHRRHCAACRSGLATRYCNVSKQGLAMSKPRCSNSVGYLLPNRSGWRGCCLGGYSRVRSPTPSHWLHTYILAMCSESIFYSIATVRRSALRSQWSVRPEV